MIKLYRTTELLLLSWQRDDGCHFHSFVMYISSLKNTASIYLEIFLIECCTVLVKPPMTSFTDVQQESLFATHPTISLLSDSDTVEQLTTCGSSGNGIHIQY